LAGCTLSATDVSGLRTTAWFVPATKIPGATVPTFTVACELATPFAVTTTLARPAPVSKGTWKFAWNWPTKINGAGVLLTAIDTPFKLLGSGVELAAPFEFA
jgi:hypothetical protein